jgi:hypothetical protein
MTVAESFVDSVVTNGFATAPECLSAREIDAVIAELNGSSLHRSRAGIRHLMQHPAVNKVARSSPLLDMACSVLGAAAFPCRATLFDKSPDSNWLVVWHQDTALPLRNREDRPGWGPWSVKEGILYAHAPAQALSEVLALRLHLDASTTDNGPLRVIAATHCQGILPHDAIEELVAKTPAIECTVPRGGVLAMRPLLVHASSKSHSQQPRRVLHIEYAARPEIEGFRLAIA